jgi:hypothetical protein
MFKQQLDILSAVVNKIASLPLIITIPYAMRVVRYTAVDNYDRHCNQKAEGIH